MTGATIIHPLALVEPGASLGVGVTVGPFCHVGAEAVLGDGVELISHVSIQGATTLGAGSRVWPQAVLGAAPQNAKHKGGPTTLTIGRNATIREAVTLHLGSDTSRGSTVVGDNANLLAYVHISHDCVVGHNCTFANVATLGGHCEVGDFVNIGGLTAIHQNTRIGHHAFVAGCSALRGDVIPFGMAVGNRASLRGLNVVGMRRSGMARSDVHALRSAVRMIFDRDTPLAENIARARARFAGTPVVQDVIGFLADHGHHRLCVPRPDAKSDFADDDGD